MVTDALLTNKKQRGKKSNLSANEILNPESTSIKSSIKKSSLLQVSLHIEDRYMNNSRGSIGPKRLCHCCAKVAQSFS